MLKNKIFYPKILSIFGNYGLVDFFQDISAGVIVGIVALPLAIAFAVASGATPEIGLITAIIGGGLISLFGGSRVQIGGPTGAFIIIVYGIIQQYGVNGLIISTIMAGFILIIMGLVRFGDFIKFIPSPVVVGFTSGIALVIFSTQVKDFLGLKIEHLPADFIHKWITYFHLLPTYNSFAVLLTILTVVIIFILKRYFPKIPGMFIALVLTTLLAQWFNFPIETIEDKFGVIHATLPKVILPHFDYQMIRNLIAPATTIALLGAIESLLSAVVSDSMIGGKHRSNTELIAQGIANVITPFFGGLPVTGAIARTATNVKNGGRTPIAGITHAITLLLILLFLSSLAGKIPMATLAGILFVVSYNMSEWREFKALFYAPKSDIAVLLTTFFLTVIFDLTIAIEIGMVLSAFLFMNRISQVSDIKRFKKVFQPQQNIDGFYKRENAISNLDIPLDIDIYEISGVLFFGTISKFDQCMRKSIVHKQDVILRMGNVPTLDATALRFLSNLFTDVKKSNCNVVFCELNDHCEKILNRSHIKLFQEVEQFSNIEDAITFLTK